MPGTTKFVSAVGGCQSVLIRKSTAFWSRVDGSDDLRPSKEERNPSYALVMQIVDFLIAEGWIVQVDEEQETVTIESNGNLYERTYEWLLGCDYSNVPTPLRNDLQDITSQLGIC